MRATRTTLLIAGAVVAAAVVGAAAIAASRDDAEPDAREISYCVVRKEAEARYAIVADAYERGELGSREQVIASAHPKVRDLIFEPSGDLREWEEMRPIARHEFLQWATSGRVHDQTGDAQGRAVLAITRADCES